MSRVEIYGLHDPDTGELRYVGKANNSAARLKSHMRETRRKTPLYAWIEKLRKLGKSPAMHILCLCEASDWQIVESMVIAERRTSCRLLNVANGGDEPYCPPSVRAENGRKAAVARQSTEQRRRVTYLKLRLGQLLKEGAVSESVKAKLRYAAEKRPELFGAWATL